MKALWRCPACQREFANTNQTHTRGRHSLDAHVEGKLPLIRAIYDAFVAAIGGG